MTDFSIFKSSYAPLFRKEDLLSFALTDAAALHALLVHSALNLRGIEQLKQDSNMLYHQGETIRLINARLRDPEQQVASDATIFTVANMTHLEVRYLNNPVLLSIKI
jgi:Fungal specific transcription factor domain